MGKVSYPGIKKLLVLIRPLPAGFELTLDTGVSIIRKSITFPSLF
jgi:hypothetical protein